MDVVSQAGKVRESIGLTGQFASVDEDLTGTQNMVMIGQLRPLVEAVLIGLTAAGITVACNLVLRLSVMSGLYHALASQNSQGRATLLDPYLAALAAW